MNKPFTARLSGDTTRNPQKLLSLPQSYALVAAVLIVALITTLILMTFFFVQRSSLLSLEQQMTGVNRDVYRLSRDMGNLVSGTGLLSDLHATWQHTVEQLTESSQGLSQQSGVRFLSSEDRRSLAAIEREWELCSQRLGDLEEMLQAFLAREDVAERQKRGIAPTIQELLSVEPVPYATLGELNRLQSLVSIVNTVIIERLLEETNHANERITVATQRSSSYLLSVTAIFLVLQIGLIVLLTASLHQQRQARMAEARQSEKLRLSEEKLSSLFASMREMVALYTLVFDAQGALVDYHVSDCNQAYAEALGRPRSDIIGHLGSKLYETNPPPFLEDFRQTLETAEAHERTAYLAPLERHFTTSFVSIGSSRVATVATDISQIVETQAILSAKTKEMEGYLYIASHDLRTPLVNIQGFSQRLESQTTSLRNAVLSAVEEQSASQRSTIDSLIEQDIPKTLSFIHSNVVKMDVLLKGLLQVSRSGREEMQVDQLDMDRIFDGILSAQDFELKQIAARVELLKPLEPCYGDKNLINRVFSNLISNAMKYRHPERRLEITISSKSQGNKSIYMVSDNGKGISERNCARIWDIFFRVDGPDPQTGEGLGLSIVKRIIDRHRGRVWVESTLGQGSTFFVELRKESWITKSQPTATVSGRVQI